MKATDQQWNTYLANRKEGPNATSKGATVIQVALAPAWAGSQDAEGNAPFGPVASCSPNDTFLPTNCSLPNPLFWRNFEDKIKSANDSGLYVFVAGIMEPVNGIAKIAEGKIFARWLASRLAGDFVVLSPGFDAGIAKESCGQDCWLIEQREVGKEIKRVVPRQLISNHWGTVEISEMDDLHTSADSWLGFHMFQSGNNRGLSQNPPPTPAQQLVKVTQRARELAWQMSGTSNPPIAPFSTLRKPAVNGEAIYDHAGIPNENFSAYRARQAGYLSWLSGGMGYTFGVGGIWDWGLCGHSLPNACGFQLPIGYRSFDEALEKPGSVNLKHMGNIMRAYNSLSFADYLDTYEQGPSSSSSNRIMNQPSAQDSKMVFGRGTDLLVAYLPFNQTIKLKMQGLNFQVGSAFLMDPRTGTSENVGVDATHTNVTCNQSQGWCEWTNRHYDSDSPADSDRLLYMFRTTTPAGAWSESTSLSDLQVFAGKLDQGGDEEAKPTSILGQLLDVDGTPSGNLIEVSNGATSPSSRPAAARYATGEFVVVWQADEDGDGWQEIRGRLLDATGSYPSGEAFRVSPEVAVDYSKPSVGIDEAGDAVIVWIASGSELEAPGIWGVAMRNSGALGTPIQLVDSIGSEVLTPRIASDRGGTFTLAWVQRDATTEVVSIQSQRFSDQLEKLSSSQQVNTTELPSYWLEPIVVDSAGNVAIEWEGRDFERSLGELQQAFDASGVAVGEETILSAPLDE